MHTSIRKNIGIIHTISLTEAGPRLALPPALWGINRTGEIVQTQTKMKTMCKHSGAQLHSNCRARQLQLQEQCESRSTKSSSSTVSQGLQTAIFFSPAAPHFFPTVVMRIVFLLTNCPSTASEATRPQHSWRKGRHWSLICIFLAHSIDIFTPAQGGSSNIHSPCLPQQGGRHTEMPEG